VPTVFSKNRDRLLEGNIAEAFFNAVLALANQHQLLSHEDFTVDGTLLEAWASHKSFRPKADPTPPPPSADDGPGYAGRNPSLNFRGETRSNTTHESVTDPDSRLTRKTHHGAAFLGYQASVLMENRHGLVVQTDVRAPGGHAECDAALEMLTLLEPTRRRRTLGADKGYDQPDFIADARTLRFTTHVSPNAHRYRRRRGKQQSAVDGRTTRHAGYTISQRKRKSIEQGFGWQKCVGGLRKLHQRGRDRVAWLFAFTSAAYNLVRIHPLGARMMGAMARDGSGHRNRGRSAITRDRPPRTRRPIPSFHFVFQRPANSQAHSIRLPGFVIGAEIIFGMPDQRLTIRHDSGSSAKPYVDGAVLAIRKVRTLTGLHRGLDAVLDL